MNYKLVFQTEAVFDIQVAFEWYEAQKAGLGYELMEEIESSIEKIVKHPLHYTLINKSYRRLKVSRFPYLIIYEIEVANIVINSVSHTSRKPQH